MVRRPLLPLCLLLAALALLAPLGAVADPCADCAGTSCCPASGCPCCLAGSSVLTGSPDLSPARAWTGLAASPAVDGGLSADPRGVFHVPKTPLA